MKKISKKLVAMIVILVLLIGAMAMSALAAEKLIDGGVCDNGLAWVLTEDGTFIISGEGPIEPEGFLNYPWGLNFNIRHVIIEEGITGIEWHAFEQCKNIETVYLPDSLVYIGERAFYGCELLTEINLSENVISIGESAFAGCINLEGIWIDKNNENIYSDEHGVVYTKYDDEKILLQAPGQLTGDYVVEEGTTKINSYAFAGCVEVKSITIPESVTKIGDSVFSGCTKLESIKLPEGLSELGFSVFTNCTSLKSIDIPDGVTTIEAEAFWGCSSLVDIDFPESLTTFEQYVFADCTSLKNVILPEGLTTVDYSAFSGCTSLTNVSIPKSLNHIGLSMFTDCSSLTSITLHDSISSIGEDAFYGCTSLTGIWVDEANKTFSSDENGVLFNKDKTRIIKIPGGLTGTYTVPANITDVSRDVFFDCAKLSGLVFDDTNPDFCSVDGTVMNKDKTELVYVPGTTSGSYTIPEGITKIGSYAFYGCDNITEIIIPEGVTNIGGYAFYGCDSITKIIIPEGVTQIGEFAFANCTGLTSIEIHSTETMWLSWSLFTDCPALTEIKFVGDAPSMGSETYSSYSGTVYYPADNNTWPVMIAYVYPYTSVQWLAYDADGNTTPYDPSTAPELPDDPNDPIIYTRPLGDINGDNRATNSDLVILARYLVDMYEKGSAKEMLAGGYGDVNQNGSVTNADLVRLARNLVED